MNECTWRGRHQAEPTDVMLLSEQACVLVPVVDLQPHYQRNCTVRQPSLFTPGPRVRLIGNYPISVGPLFLSTENRDVTGTSCSTALARLRHESQPTLYQNKNKWALMRLLRCTDQQTDFVKDVIVGLRFWHLESNHKLDLSKEFWEHMYVNLYIV